MGHDIKCPTNSLVSEKSISSLKRDNMAEDVLTQLKDLKSQRKDVLDLLEMDPNDEETKSLLDVLNESIETFELLIAEMSDNVSTEVLNAVESVLVKNEDSVVSVNVGDNLRGDVSDEKEVEMKKEESIVAISKKQFEREKRTQSWKKHQKKKKTGGIRKV